MRPHTHAHPASAPRLSLTIASEKYAIRFVDEIVIDELRHRGWVDTQRQELLIAVGGFETSTNVHWAIGAAMMQAIFQLQPEYGVDPTSILRRSTEIHREFPLDGNEWATWLKSGLDVSLQEMAMTHPIVEQKANGRWPCPLCRWTSADWRSTWNTTDRHPLRDHVERAHGFPASRLRFKRHEDCIAS